MRPSRLDSIYRRMLITRFFEKGWGKPENLQRLFEFRKIISQRETCYKLIPNDYPVKIVSERKYTGCIILEGKFMTPLEWYLPGVVPRPAQEAHFQVLLPNNWSQDKHKPICIHLAGTGDHYYWRRRHFIAKPLLKEANIGAILLENPFYGLRKPDNQIRSNLHNVSDIFVMGGCLILECLVLLHWCERNGFGPLGITGISMGGHMASLAGTNWPKPLVLVPCLSWTSAANVFTTGVMSQSINWDMLENQYYSDGNYRERLSKMVTVIDDAFSAGQKFIKNFNQSLKELEKDIKHTRHIQQSSPIDCIKFDGHNSIFLKKQIDNKNINMTSMFSKHEAVHDDISCKVKNDLQSGFNNITTSATTSATLNNVITANENKNSTNVNQFTLTKLMNYILPKGAENRSEKIDITKTNWWEREALQFMRGIMDECTHLKNFSVPYDTSLIIAVCAKDDAYVPREGCASLEDIWPGAEVRYLDAGHVSAYVLHQKLFRSCIIEAFDKAKKNCELNTGSKTDDLKSSLTFHQL